MKALRILFINKDGRTIELILDPERQGKVLIDEIEVKDSQ